MEEFVDYYEILELEKNALIEEIEEAIKKTRKRFRRLEGSPDAMQRANAERMMQLLNEADSLFHNSSKRLEYDATYDSGKSDSKRDLEKDARAATAEKDWTSEAKDYFKNGQSANACFAAREATRNCSTDAEAWLVWALAAYSMDKYDESIFAASELLKLGSNQATAHRLLGDSYIMIDKYADAEAEFLKAQQIDKSDYTIMARLVDARYLQGKFDQALTMARNLHEAHPDYGPVLSSLCRCLETDVENKMSSKDNAGYFTNMKQIQHAELVVSEMRALGNIDKADEEWIEKMEGLIDWARKTI